MEKTVNRRDTFFAKWEHEVGKSVRQRNPHPSDITERSDRLWETCSAVEDVQTEIKIAAESQKPMAAIFNHQMELDNIYCAVKTIYVANLDTIRDRSGDDTVASLQDVFKQVIKSLVETQERFLTAQAAVSTNIGELAAQQRRPQVDGSSAGELHPNTNLRLSVFAIPVFRGDRKKWRTFKDLFVTGIHNCDNISDVLKLQYLLSCLDGEAKSLVSAFPISDDNDNPSFHHEFLKFLQERCDALETFSAFTKMPYETDDSKNNEESTKITERTSTGSTSTVKPAQAKNTGSTSRVKPAQYTQVSESSTSKVVACSGGLMEDSKRFPASSITVLPTVLVNIRDKHSLLHESRVLIDSGSQVSLITQEFAAKLAIPRCNARLVVTGLSQLATRTTKGVVHLFISSRFSDSVVLYTDAYIPGRLTAPLPRLELDEAKFKHLDKLPDPLYYEAGPIDVILGFDVFLSMIRDEQTRNESNRPVAQNSAFGWIISGKFYNGVTTVGELDN